MNVVKIRRVGNSNVISLPRELEALGYTEGAQVVLEELENGGVQMLPASQVRQLMREAGQQVLAENKVAFDILAKHDSGKQMPAE
jgi:antitoxin component of MazEF toxin-antitoxin module